MSVKWSKAPLGEIFTIARGGSPRPIDDYITESEDGINWIMIGDAVEGTKYIRSTKKRIRRAGVERSRMVKPGDFLLTNSMSFGKPYILQTDGCIHDGWLVLSPREANVCQDYFYHLLGSDVVYSEFAKRASGAVVKNLNIDLVKGVEVPYPPLTEQKRIAAILDKADAIRRKRQQALRLTDDFLRSIFLHMFGDPVSNSKGFQRGTIRDLVDTVNYGTSEKAHLTDGEYPVLRMNNLTYAGGWDFKSLKYVDLDRSSVHKYLVSNGQMLFNRTNSKELVGKTAVYRRDVPMAYAGYLVRATAKPDADSEYISAYLNSKHGKAILLGMCKSIVGMANINAQEMLSIPILLPPKELQKSFGDIVRLVEKRREFQHQAIEASGTLFSSLQQRAFSGLI